MQMKDEGCKIADRDNNKKQFQSHSSYARLPVIDLHPKHDIPFVVNISVVVDARLMFFYV
jgi:hypothetical protein